ncbi:MULTISPECIES: ArsB/NhaD family transporter [unclassified Paenibacillus]|uniref:ArsB/NhaD family transporter n=1 Tax=unclassified Paenibacillus TaxID=185978 RepID=UPI0010D1E71C|nr:MULTISPECIES: ArsB/NhaD family transporter [unclassified Paenibacillus]NIK69816.1 Na+/H+ antiporter NhaD/arsenite permease-like protein [Paenibacillus sp. BK720]TCM97652.1 putative tyrosine transporter P-protein [Paenibacillus sp. BK033]
MEPIYHPAAWQVTAAVVIFLTTYAIIITEKINRTVIALFGAVIMIALGVLDMKLAFSEHIEWETIFLLIGMMILVGITNKTGVFQYAAVKAAQTAKGDPVKIFIILSLLTGLGSAFLDNVTTVLLIVPITFSITRILNITPVPFLLAEILSSNIGGTATLIGDPPNIMIGSANENLTFNDFLVNLAPVILVILVVTIALLVWIYRKKLIVTEEAKKELMNLIAEDNLTDRKLMIKSLSVLLLTIVGFILHSVIHIEAAAIALGGATLLMLIGVKREDAEAAFDMVEWETIFFFVGLFMLVGGLVETNIISDLANFTLQITSGDMTKTSMLILWVSGIASATIDNIPFVATMIPLIQDLGIQMKITNPDDLNPLWWSLSLGACLGGNGTLIGASANVVVAGLAMREGKGFSYMDYLKIGAPLTLLALVISTIYIYFIVLP